MRLGIDFGTTRTVVAVALEGRVGLASFDVDGEFRDYLPGLMVWHKRRASFGWDAVAALEEDPQHILRSIKRLAAQAGPDGVAFSADGAEWTALDLISDYLSYVRTMLVERSNLSLSAGEPLEAFIAVPANANTQQRYLTMEAFRRAGFRVLRMLNEPTAAAIEFASRHKTALSDRSPKRYVVIYDLGGGTFDTSAISLEGRRFELLASEGISALGGDDFDEVILDMALEQLGLRIEDLAAHTRHRLLEVCREAKETLKPTSRKVLVDVSLWLSGAQPLVLDAPEVFARCERLVNRTVHLIQQVFSNLESHGIDASNLRELGALYLVGGAAAFPSVGRVLRSMYKRKIQLAMQPHAATAVGLAVASDPQANLLIREASTWLFGVWREQTFGKLKHFDQLLGKDSEPDSLGQVVAQRRYVAHHNIGHLRFVECTAIDPQGEPAGDLIPWHDVYFPYDAELAQHPRLEEAEIRRSAEGFAEIEETYVYRADGVIDVTITNLSHGYERRYSLTPRQD